MYRQYSNTNANRYFPTVESSRGSYAQPQPYQQIYRTPINTNANKYIQSRIIYGTRNFHQDNGFQTHPQFLSSSSKLTELNQKIVDDTNLLRKKNSSKRKKIFDNRETKTQYRGSTYSLESNPQSRNSRENFIQYNNPISGKLAHRSKSREREREKSRERQREISKQIAERQLRKSQEESIRNENNINIKAPILFKYSTPSNNQRRPQVYKSSISDLMKKPVVFKSMELRQSHFQQNHNASSNTYNTFNPQGQVLKEPPTENKYNFRQINKEEVEPAESDNQDDRFFDMDFKTSSTPKDQIREIDEGYLSPVALKSPMQAIHSKSNGNIVTRLKKLLQDADSDGKLITIILIVLGVILVLFQAIK